MYIYIYICIYIYRFRQVSVQEGRSQIRRRQRAYRRASGQNKMCAVYVYINRDIYKYIYIYIYIYIYRLRVNPRLIRTLNPEIQIVTVMYALSFTFPVEMVAMFSSVYGQTISGLCALHLDPLEHKSPAARLELNQPLH